MPKFCVPFLSSERAYRQEWLCQENAQTYNCH